MTKGKACHKPWKVCVNSSTDMPKDGKKIWQNFPFLGRMQHTFPMGAKLAWICQPFVYSSSANFTCISVQHDAHVERKPEKFCVWVIVLYAGSKIGGLGHRHGMDKYLDTLYANQTGWKALPTCHRPLPKVVIAKWRTVRVIISLFLTNQSQQSSFAVTGYAKAGRRWSPITCRLL